jgi:citrate lyase synthetase
MGAMTKDYRGETGVIGKWKGYEVYVLTKEQYMDLTNKSDYTVYVISDDNDKMIYKGSIIGNLMMETGTVIESRQGEYRPVRRMAKPQEEKKETGEYDQYAQVVNEFFKHLQDPAIVSD